MGREWDSVVPKYYESIGSPEKWHQYSGPINLVDFIWETEGCSFSNRRNFGTSTSHIAQSSF